jgi:hypothetical protein
MIGNLRKLPRIGARPPGFRRPGHLYPASTVRGG